MFRASGVRYRTVLVLHDVSRSRTLSERMAHLVQHDYLTRLPSRSLLTERLAQSIGLALRNARKIALLFLDLDHFKNINDSLGHAIGDELLQSVAARLQSCVRATDTVCRQGGDEFVIPLSEVEDFRDAALVAEKIGKAFQAPHQIASHELHISLSVGISVYPQDGVGADVLMQAADTAIIEMGRNLNQRVVAEGVETPEQLALLRARHCDEGQGYQFSHPLSAVGFERLLQAPESLA